MEHSVLVISFWYYSLQPIIQFKSRQVISESTCIHGSLLDLVITNIPDVIQNITIDKLTSPSDHYIIYFDINFTHSSSNVIQSITKLNYSSADYQGMSDFFFINLHSLSVFYSNSLWTLIKNIIYTACDSYVPKFKIPSHSSPKYFTSEIRHNIKCIHSKKRLLKRHYSSSLAHKLQIMESELQQRIIYTVAHIFTNYAHLHLHIQFLFSLLSLWNLIPFQLTGRYTKIISSPQERKCI